jgi:hypothetical protein
MWRYIKVSVEREDSGFASSLHLHEGGVQLMSQIN